MIDRYCSCFRAKSPKDTFALMPSCSGSSRSLSGIGGLPATAIHGENGEVKLFDELDIRQIFEFLVAGQELHAVPLCVDEADAVSVR